MLTLVVVGVPVLAIGAFVVAMSLQERRRLRRSGWTATDRRYITSSRPHAGSYGDVRFGGLRGSSDGSDHGFGDDGGGDGGDGGGGD